MLTYEEAATTLSKAAGREIRYVAVDDQAFIKSLVETGAPADLAGHLAQLFSIIREGTSAAVSPAVEKLTGKLNRHRDEEVSCIGAIHRNMNDLEVCNE